MSQFKPTITTKLKRKGLRTFSGGKYNTGGKEYKLSRESLERLSFIQKLPCVFHSNSLHFPFNFLSLCLSLSLLSSRSHAELLLQGHDCRLASRLISLFIPLSHSWLTNRKKGKTRFQFLSAVSWKSLKGIEGQRIGSMFPVSCTCRSSTGVSAGG